MLLMVLGNGAGDHFTTICTNCTALDMCITPVLKYYSYV